MNSFSAWLATRQLNTDALAAIIPALRAASQQLLQQGGAQLGQGQQGQGQDQQGQGQGQGQREREGVQAQLEDAPQLQQLLRAAAGRVTELMRCERFLSGGSLESALNGAPASLGRHHLRQLAGSYGWKRKQSLRVQHLCGALVLGWVDKETVFCAAHSGCSPLP